MTTKVRDLIKLLESIDPDLPVVLQADHSQTPMKITGWGDGYVEDFEEYMMQEVDEEDEEAVKTAKKVFFLQAY